MQQRQSIIVYLKNINSVNQLRKLGTLFYVSKAMNYAVLYVNRNDAELVLNKILSMSFIKSAQISKKADLKVKS